MKRASTLCVVFLTILPAPGQSPERGFQLSPIEQRLLVLTNAERKKNDVAPLRGNATLFQVARAHSFNMAKQGKMEHELDGKTPFDRLNAASFRYSWAGENIAYGDGSISLDAIMRGWMDSEGHRRNILNPMYTDIGLGIARDPNGRLFYTQVFARPR